MSRNDRSIDFDMTLNDLSPDKPMTEVILRISGRVPSEQNFTFQQLMGIDDEYQIEDVSKIDPTRSGAGIWLKGILNLVEVQDDAKFLGLHSSHDDFHASIPLAEVRERGFIIYRFDELPLSRDQGGPVRFYIPDHASCKTADIDECANVKFVDHMELTVERGFDNRPEDEDEHAQLHSK